MVVGIALLAFPVSCDEEDDGQDREQIVQVMNDLQRSFAERDLDAICARVTTQAHLEAGLFVHGVPSTCRRHVHRFISIFAAAGGDPARTPRVRRIEVDGDRATVVARLRETRLEIPLTQRDGDWKLSAMSGIPESRAATVASAAYARDYPSPLAAPVALSRSPRGRRCAAFIAPEQDAVLPQGGCSMQAGGDVRIAIVTPFGRFPFDECRLDIEVTADSRGRTWTSTTFSGGRPEGGCRDIYRCQDTSKDVWPWRGRISSSGSRLLHVSDACLKTCLGNFHGPLLARLERRGGRLAAWHLRADVGGFSIRGRLDVDAGGVSVMSGR